MYMYINIFYWLVNIFIVVVLSDNIVVMNVYIRTILVCILLTSWLVKET